MLSRVRVIHTSNGYQFNDPKGAASKGFLSKSAVSGTIFSEFGTVILNYAITLSLKSRFIIFACLAYFAVNPRNPRIIDFLLFIDKRLVVTDFLL